MEWKKNNSSQLLVTLLINSTRIHIYMYLYYVYNYVFQIPFLHNTVNDDYGINLTFLYK